MPAGMIQKYEYFVIKYWLDESRTYRRREAWGVGSGEAGQELGRKGLEDRRTQSLESPGRKDTVPPSCSVQ
jgi:hypothetical protein